jgi:hypothetical protein
VSPQKTAAWLLGISAGGLVLCVALPGGHDASGPARSARANVPPAPAAARDFAVLPPPAPLRSLPVAQALRASGAHHAERPADDLLCERETATGPGQSAGLASSPAGDPAVVRAEHRIGAALRASSDPFAQAVALWLDPERQVPGSGQRQEQLARLAETTADPRVYALAFRTCLKNGAEDAPACQSLNARQWARLDAGNAMPWMYVLAESIAQADLAGRDDALFQIASSARVEQRSFAVAQAILDQAGTDGPSLVAANELVTQARGMDAIQALPLLALVGICRDRSGLDEDTARRCGAAAELLVSRSDTLALRDYGGQVDFAVTSDPARRDHLRMEAVKLGSAPQPHKAGGCKAMQDAQAFLRRAAEEGEVAALGDRGGT